MVTYNATICFFKCISLHCNVLICLYVVMPEGVLVTGFSKNLCSWFVFEMACIKWILFIIVFHVGFQANLTHLWLEPYKDQHVDHHRPLKETHANEILMIYMLSKLSTVFTPTLIRSEPRVLHQPARGRSLPAREWQCVRWNRNGSWINPRWSICW